jgi:phosphoglycolate phosphatase
VSGLRLVVFDLDGTLIDSRRDLADAANALIEEHGGRPLPVDAIAGMVGEGAALLVRRALSAAGARLDVARDLPRFLELYDQCLLAHTRLYDGTREMLDVLAQKVALAVLTNKPQQHTDAILRGLAIAARFRWVIGGDSGRGADLPGPVRIRIPHGGRAARRRRPDRRQPVSGRTIRVVTKPRA